MKKFLIRLTSFIYYKLTGLRVSTLQEVHKDMKGSFTALQSLARKYANVPDVIPWNKRYSELDDKDTQDLAELFKKYGSDKSTRHNYYVIYADVLKGRRNEEFMIFEMGLGKPSASVLNTCASSKAFRDWAPKAQIYGADIEHDLLFQEDRITTYYADQTDPESLEKVATQLPVKFDLIIDDGLHSPWANFNTIEFALPLLKERGVMVIEDINKVYEEYWPVLQAMIGQSYTCELIMMRYQMVCVISKKTN